MSDFKVGDKVVLKSGGHEMTVTNLREDAATNQGQIVCNWFGDDIDCEGNLVKNRYNTIFITPNCLEKVM